jgi:hypothetical protein
MMTLPQRAGRKPRTIVSTSGSSGMGVSTIRNALLLYIALPRSRSQPSSLLQNPSKSANFS